MLIQTTAGTILFIILPALLYIGLDLFCRGQRGGQQNCGTEPAAPPAGGEAGGERDGPHR